MRFFNTLQAWPVAVLIAAMVKKEDLEVLARGPPYGGGVATSGGGGTVWYQIRKKTITKGGGKKL